MSVDCKPTGLSGDEIHCMRLQGLTRRHPSAVIVLLVIVCSFAFGTAFARHRREPSAGTPGDFAYYVLSLSWSPAYCLSAPAAAECNGPRRFAFIVHGLWPQYEQGWPEHCDVRRAVPDDVVRGIADVMPARGLVYHEWSTHGTCSGLEPAEFFALLRRAAAGIVIPQPLSSPAQAMELAPAAVAGAFLRANARLQPRSIVVTCTGQDTPRLREVHICLDRDLMPRDCSPGAMRGACKAPQVIIPPIR